MLTTQPQAQRLFRLRDHKTGDTVEPGLAFVPDKAGSLAALEALARREYWGRSDRAVLKNYLDFTVRQLIIEGKIISAADDEGKPVATFNTGLLTEDTQPIYAFLEHNHTSVPDAEQWFFKGWAVSSDLVMRHFPRMPERARYWKQSPGELLFHPDWDVEPRLEHIVGENVDRFPPLLQQHPHLRKHALRGGIHDVLRQIEADPHLAVPAYHFERGSVSLLLPLRLIDAATVDLALVIGPFGENRYAAWTVYPLFWAYQNARLIKAPSADWIGGPFQEMPSEDAE